MFGCIISLKWNFWGLRCEVLKKGAKMFYFIIFDFILLWENCFCWSKVLDLSAAFSCSEIYLCKICHLSVSPFNQKWHFNNCCFSFMKKIKLDVRVLLYEFVSSPESKSCSCTVNIWLAKLNLNVKLTWEKKHFLQLATWYVWTKTPCSWVTEWDMIAFSQPDESKLWRET